MIRFIRNAFITPTAFRGDPRGHALNQVGHMLLIGLAPVWLGAPFWLVLALFAIWEFAQWRIHRAEAWDCVEDFAFVSSGAVGVACPLVLAAASLFLWSGALRRKQEAEGAG